MSILILDYTSLYYASSGQGLDEALDIAYFQYRASKTYNAVTGQFSAAFETYTILQFIGFILKNRL